jgi:hypothetical protein
VKETEGWKILPPLSTSSATGAMFGTWFRKSKQRHTSTVSRNARTAVVTTLRGYVRYPQTFVARMRVCVSTFGIPPAQSSASRNGSILLFRRFWWKRAPPWISTEKYPLSS